MVSDLRPNPSLSVCSPRCPLLQNDHIIRIVCLSVCHLPFSKFDTSTHKQTTLFRQSVPNAWLTNGALGSPLAGLCARGLECTSESRNPFQSVVTVFTIHVNLKHQAKSSPHPVLWSHWLIHLYPSPKQKIKKIKKKIIINNKNSNLTASCVLPRNQPHEKLTKSDDPPLSWSRVLSQAIVAS